MIKRLELFGDHDAPFRIEGPHLFNHGLQAYSTHRLHIPIQIVLRRCVLEHPAIQIRDAHRVEHADVCLLKIHRGGLGIRKILWPAILGSGVAWLLLCLLV